MLELPTNVMSYVAPPHAQHAYLSSSCSSSAKSVAFPVSFSSARNVKIAGLISKEECWEYVILNTAEKILYS